MVLILQVLGTGGTAHRAKLPGKTPVWSGGRRWRAGEALRPMSFLGFRGKGRINRLGLACVNNFHKLRAIVVVSSYLAPSPRLVKAEEYCLLERMDQIDEVWLWIGSIAYQQCAEPFTTSKNWLADGGTVSLQPERFVKMSKHHNTQKFKTHTHTRAIP